MPMDSVDMAQDIRDTYLENLLLNHRHKPDPQSGLCLCCEEPVVNRRYCDSVCRDTHERAARMKVIEGRPEH